MRDRLKTIKFYTVKLPLILIAIAVGFIFEFIITFPFLVFCTIDSIGNVTKRETPSPGDN